MYLFLILSLNCANLGVPNVSKCVLLKLLCLAINLKLFQNAELQTPVISNYRAGVTTRMLSSIVFVSYTVRFAKMRSELIPNTWMTPAHLHLLVVLTTLNESLRQLYLLPYVPSCLE